MSQKKSRKVVEKSVQADHSETEEKNLIQIKSIQITIF